MTRQSPDTQEPLRHLSPYEKQLLLAMVPSWNERWRMNKPHLTQQAREALILTFLTERRRLYEHCFKLQCASANIDPPVRRDLLEQDRLARYRPLINSAIAAANDRRQHSDRDEWFLRRAVENRERERRGLPEPTPEDDDEAYRKRRARRQRF